MHDLPSQLLLQQSSAQQISGQDLEMLGKEAASFYLCGEACNLTEAVVETVKCAGLSPEQVLRVVEFANQSAYLKEFAKQSAAHKYVNFEGGPADPAEVLRDLNDGGGGTVFDRGNSDYNEPPPTYKVASVQRNNREALGLTKTAGAPVEEAREFQKRHKDRLSKAKGLKERRALHMFDHEPTKSLQKKAYATLAEQEFDQMWGAEPEPYAYADPWADAVDMREKLASAADLIVGELSMAETEFEGICEDMYQQVKQASLQGVSLGQVVQAWGEVVPGPEYMKLAFSTFGDRLVREGVMSLGYLTDSLEKKASAGAMVNEEHPLVGVFSAFCVQLDKLAHLRSAREEVVDNYDKVQTFLKEASKSQVAGNYLRKGWEGLNKGTQAVGGAFRETATGFGAPTVGKALDYGTQALPYLGGAMVGKEVYDRTVKHGPLGGVKRYFAGHMPGTPEYSEREYNLMMAGRKFGGGGGGGVPY